MSSLKRLAAAALGLFAVATACSNDYDQFAFPDQGPATGGSAGTTGGTSGVGAVGALPGTGGTSGSGTGGATTGGTGGSATGGAAGSTGGTGAGCGAGAKFCSATTSCVLMNNPATNCAAADCTPCDIPNATEQCTNGACAILQCDPGFNNCDADANTGCEQTLDDPLHCGACDRACSSTNSVSQDCTVSGTTRACAHTCAAGFSDCVSPASDDGCETNTSTSATRCGNCSNDCSGSIACVGGVCGCTANSQCNLGTSGTCDTTTNLCVCGTTTCVAGEGCDRRSGNTVCTCNDGTRCTGTGRQVCCQSPAGCVDVDTDQNNCGGCGRVCGTGTTCCAGGCIDTTADLANCGGCGVACTGGQSCCNSGCIDTLTDEANCGGCGTACAGGQTCCGGSCIDINTDTSHCGACDVPCALGLICTGGLCSCTNDDSCNAGGVGTCAAGLCTCGATPCTQGQQCTGVDVCG